MSYANVLSAGASAALNTYISPRYAKLANQDRAPGQPIASAFSIWFPIYAGQIGYGLLPDEEQSREASLWNHAIALAGAGYAWTLVNERFYSMQATMALMTGASIMYRRALPEATSLGARAVRFTAEVGVGWLVAADLIVAAQNTRRALGRGLSHPEQDAVGAAEAVVLTGAAVAANRLAGWSGVSVAAAWALGGIALDKRSEKHVRAIAGVAAVGVLGDLGLKFMGSLRADAGISTAAALEDGYESSDDMMDEFVVVEDTFVSPGIIIEEVTSYRV